MRWNFQCMFVSVTLKLYQSVVRQPLKSPSLTMETFPLVMASPASRPQAAHLALATAAREARAFSFFVPGTIISTAPAVLKLFEALSDVLIRFPDALHFDETVTRTALAATRILFLVYQPAPAMVQASALWTLPLKHSTPSVRPFFVHAIRPI